MERFEGDDFQDEDRAIVKTSSGQAVFLPLSARRLSGEPLEVYSDLMRQAMVVAEGEAVIRELVDQARQLGVSWSLIGAAVGFTGEGARTRYGSDE